VLFDDRALLEIEKYSWRIPWPARGEAAHSRKAHIRPSGFSQIEHSKNGNLFPHMARRQPLELKT
jgi:hypothetical protein